MRIASHALKSDGRRQVPCFKKILRLTKDESLTTGNAKMKCLRQIVLEPQRRSPEIQLESAAWREQTMKSLEASERHEFHVAEIAASHGLIMKPIIVARWMRGIDLLVIGEGLFAQTRWSVVYRQIPS
jgi:hypothetical protein